MSYTCTCALLSSVLPENAALGQVPGQAKLPIPKKLPIEIISVGLQASWHSSHCGVIVLDHTGNFVVCMGI